MFMDIIYFIGTTSFFIGTTGALLYFYDKEFVKNMAYEVGYWSIEKYGRALNWVDSMNFSQDNEEGAFIIYKDNIQRTTDTMPAHDESDLVIYKKYINHKPFYKIINKNESSEDFQPLEKPFLQVEIKYGDKQFEIQDKLQHFYISGNQLTYTFFVWFMKYHFNETVDGDIEFNVIDNMVNLFSFRGNDKVIHLNIDGYKIENI